MEDNRINWPEWETVKIIGRGSFGAVYEIQRDVFGDVEKAALKVISIPQNASDIDEMYGDGYDDESITSTFQSHLKSIVAEYSLMRKMNGSANIVNCDDIRYVQHDDGIGWDIFIKMELLTPLAKALPADIPEETVIKVAKDMCAALELCQKHGIVHRDIKPQNIFLSPNGDYKLGDFGIAKTVEKTMGGTKIGTYKYMAPEVYNNQPYGTAADIYSLGLVLYWMLNERRTPFLPLPSAKIDVKMDEAARLRRFQGEKLPSPAHGSADLKKIVLKACAYDPKDRYATAAEMLTALQGLGDGTVTTVVVDPTPDPPPTPDPAPKLNKNRVIISSICVALVLLIGSIVAAGSGSNTQHTHDWLPASCAYPKRCKLCGQTEGEITNVHEWKPATCDEPKTCKICGETEGSRLGHQWVDTDKPSSLSKMCTVCNLRKGIQINKPLTYCEVLEHTNEEGSTTDVAVGSWEDVFGNVHTDSLKLWVRKASGYTNTEHIIYKLEGKYEFLVGSVVASSSSKDGSATQILIYADGQKIYDSGLIYRDTPPVEFAIDISDVNQLKVECVTESSKSGHCILEAKLSTP